MSMILMHSDSGYQQLLHAHGGTLAQAKVETKVYWAPQLRAGLTDESNLTHVCNFKN